MAPLPCGITRFAKDPGPGEYADQLPCICHFWRAEHRASDKLGVVRGECPGDSFGGIRVDGGTVDEELASDDPVRLANWCRLSP